MSREEILFTWITIYMAALASFSGRLLWRLGIDPNPPEDAAAAARWQRRRRWLIVSEFAALPSFATAGLLGVLEGWLDPVGGMIFGFVAGALGFAFFVHALHDRVARKLGIDGTQDTQAGPKIGGVGDTP